MEEPVFKFPNQEKEDIRLPFRSNREKAISFAVHHNLADTSPQTLGNFGAFFVAPFPCTLVKAYERHDTAASNATLGIYVEKLTATTARGSGLNMLASNFDGKSTANTTQSALPSKVVTSGVLDSVLNTGDAVGIFPTATPTALKDVVITLVFKTDLANLPV